MKLKQFLLPIALLFTNPALAADLVHLPQDPAYFPPAPTTSISGYPSVIDGRTLYFPSIHQTLRLYPIDTCELPQWSIRPGSIQEGRHSEPMPCGALAKAWLRRAINNQPVHCTVLPHDQNKPEQAICEASGKDLGLEMLRVGLAKLDVSFPTKSSYLLAQNNAMTKRYGIWSTYVLDMAEWRKKAVDKTLTRQPIADLHLLNERQSEISPAFSDARNRPYTTER
ncbi:thermonuclease family protein [Allorhizobium sp. BGMRC 0089]|uniref:thermonuclease family protein n=1 Tax=Allorhizobium sonneratiae TaxID=2934936 RepID=UPI00203327D4|nr:thermonuclease family protein [Allorhizobium sonneratiae]MCM2294701.1 thermonuclease family protein [Allorhizobium sonneratiae]